MRHMGEMGVWVEKENTSAVRAGHAKSVPVENTKVSKKSLGIDQEKSRNGVWRTPPISFPTHIFLKKAETPFFLSLPECRTTTFAICQKCNSKNPPKKPKIICSASSHFFLWKPLSRRCLSRDLYVSFFWKPLSRR